MALGFSNINEEYEHESELYDSGCSMLGTSDDVECAEEQSDKYDKSVSVLGVHT